MDIFIIDLDNFNLNNLQIFSEKFDEYKLYKNELKKHQHFAGLYIVKQALNNFYNIQNYQIKYVNKKPVLENYELHFSISHCQNIIAVAFSDSDVGFDIEYNKKYRNFLGIMNRFTDELPKDYEAVFNSFNDEKKYDYFYKFWTNLEAKIKLSSNDSEVFYISGIINDDYTYSIASSEKNLVYNIITLAE